MARKSKREHQGPCQARGHDSVQQNPTTRNNRLEAIEKTKIMNELVAPVFSFPFAVTYISELEISDPEDMGDTAAETTTQTPEQNRMHFNDENQLKYSSATIERSWNHQSYVQRGNYSAQNQTPLAVWKNQGPVEEPFNDIGEVCSKSEGRQRGGHSHRQLRYKKGKKRGGF